MSAEELLGRKIVEYEGLRVEYARLLQLLLSVTTGNLPASRVIVNLEAQSWTVLAETENPPQSQTATVILEKAEPGIKDRD